VAKVKPLAAPALEQAGSGGFSTTRGGGVTIFGGLFTEGFGIGATGAALRSAGVLSAGAAITG